MRLILQAKNHLKTNKLFSIMKTSKIITFIVLFVFMHSSANAIDGTNENTNQRKIVISQTSQPRPHIIDLIEPEAYYNINTANLTFYLDQSYYSEYTVTLSSDYASQDYIVTSPVINIPVSSLGDVVEIYIESDDCGCYEGVLVKSDYTNSY